MTETTPTTSAEAGDAVKLMTTDNAVEQNKLPELPEAAYTCWDDYYDGWSVYPAPEDRYHNVPLYSADQMREYASAALSAQAERVRELEEALQEYIDADEVADGHGYGVGGGAMAKARAAIEKATGSALSPNTEGGGNAD